MRSYDVMFTAQAAEILGVSQEQVRQTIRNGDLWGRKTGSWYVCDSLEVLQLAARTLEKQAA
jgi:hypothetical protein